MNEMEKTVYSQATDILGRRRPVRGSHAEGEDKYERN